jgi:hypothetical protein
MTFKQAVEIPARLERAASRSGIGRSPPLSYGIGSSWTLLITPVLPLTASRRCLQTSAKDLTPLKSRA